MGPPFPLDLKFSVVMWPGGNFSFILPQSLWQRQESLPSIHLCLSGNPLVAMAKAKVQAWGIFARAGNFYFILPQSPWPRRESPPLRDDKTESWATVKAWGNVQAGSTFAGEEKFFVFPINHHRFRANIPAQGKRKSPQNTCSIIITYHAESLILQFASKKYFES